jgi:hypothetical protein
MHRSSPDDWPPTVGYANLPQAFIHAPFLEASARLAR